MTNAFFSGTAAGWGVEQTSQSNAFAFTVPKFDVAGVSPNQDAFDAEGETFARAMLEHQASMIAFAENI